MNKTEALTTALTGAKIRLVGWPPNEFFEYYSGAFRDMDGEVLNYTRLPDVEGYETYTAALRHPKPEDIPAEELDLSPPEPQEAAPLAFGTGELLITKGQWTTGFLIGVERSPFGPRPIGSAVLRVSNEGGETRQFAAELSFPTEEQRDAVFNAMLNRKAVELKENVDYVKLDTRPVKPDVYITRHVLPERPDCEPQFREWYWKSGTELNPNAARLVWHAAQHALYVALKEQV